MFKAFMPVQNKVTETEIRDLLARTEGRKGRAIRSIRKECRLWLKQNTVKVKPVKVSALLYSQQDGRTTEKLIIAIG